MRYQGDSVVFASDKLGFKLLLPGRFACNMLYYILDIDNKQTQTQVKLTDCKLC